MEHLNSVTVDGRRTDSAVSPHRPAADPAQGGPDFAAVLDRVQAPASENTSPQDSLKTAAAPRPADAQAQDYTVRSGDSLSAIAQNVARQRGLQLSGRESYRLALDLAARNQIRNPDRIQPGQQLQLGGLQTALDDSQRWRPLSATAALPPEAASTQSWLASRASPAASPVDNPPALASNALPQRGEASSTGAHPVLQQTLDRAVARGFIPAQEKQAVQGKILQLAQKYQFAPDDFARMTLMESDGMNPRASNQRCHGIIQFCDGPNRGAASVGYGQQPRAILGLSVYQQLHLVDNYFQDTGLGKQGPAKLDDLYLTVLQPGARQEKQAHTPLNIQGPQARDLHVGADTRQAITRQSIVEGLLKNTREKLSQVFGQNVTPRPAPVQIAQATGTRQTLVR